MMAEADGSEDVTDFLKRIRELGDERDREDEERNRKLEEEILQGRKEREARRAERARSLSPTKDSVSNAGTPHSMRSTFDTSMHEANISPSNTPQLPPVGKSRVQNNIQSAEHMAGSLSHKQEARIEKKVPQPLPKPSFSANNPSSAAMAPSRSNTLSWQQRPSSRGSAMKGRLSPKVASEDSAAESSPLSIGPSPIIDTSVSRNEIAQSLAAKEPAFFKQTEERASTSAAYRRNQIETGPGSPAEARAMRLPGLTKEASTEPENSSLPPEPIPPPSSSREGSTLSDFASTNHDSSSALLSSAGNIQSPLPTMRSQRFDQPSLDTASSLGGETASAFRASAMSPSQGRISPERLDRPSSPTKGLGGFVQSAMLKRSDSVNKRWSAQAGPGLSRGNSVASNRSGYDGSLATLSGMAAPRDPRGSLSRETSPVAHSRPSSRHSNITVTKAQEHEEHKASSEVHSDIDRSMQSHTTFAKPTFPLRRETHSFPEMHKEPRISERSPPASPSKKWSPTKPSWLENAINKSDSPKAKAAAPQPPSWMSELHKAKQQKASGEHDKPGENAEIKTEGFLRSPAVGNMTKSPSTGAFPSGVNSNITPLSKVERPDRTPPVKDTGDKLPPDEKTTDNTKTQAEASPDKEKPATPPKKDFVNGLRPRNIPGDKRNSEEPEFKSAFAKLKRTQTQNYKAPDELKDNIMRGKAGLNITGGPKKTERKDEFKESILKKKEGMKAGLPSASTTLTSASGRFKSLEAQVPEALAKRQGLTRSGNSMTNIMVKPNESAGHPSIASKKSEVAGSEQTESEGPTNIVSKPTLESIAKDRVRGDFNAALAGVITKGPSPRARDEEPKVSGSQGIDRNNQSPQEPGPQLSHMTKSRARGPKRKPPTSATERNLTTSSNVPASSETPSETEANNKRTQSSSQTVKGPTSPPKSPVSRPLSNISNNHRRVSQPSSPRKPSTSVDLPKDKQTSPKSSPEDFPSIASKTSPQVKQRPNMSPEFAKPRKPSTSAGLAANSAKSPQKQKQLRKSSLTQTEPLKAPEEESVVQSSVKSAAATWQKQRPPSIQPNSMKSPITLPARRDEDLALEQAGFNTATSDGPVGRVMDRAESRPLGDPVSNRDRSSSSTTSPKFPRSPKSPPLPGKKPAGIANRVPSSSLLASVPRAPSSVSPTTEASRVLVDFFGQQPSCKTKFNISTQAIIASRSKRDGSDKIKTLRKQIYQVASDGKLLPVPSQQEHVLFEENLYLCTHVFGSMSGVRTTEVYLWAGDGVPTSAVEDAQLFCRKVAKENNGKLVILKQGKETANFFQALGGIVITRRGSSAKANPLPTYILCGRRHVGQQVAFDEVDLKPSSLCHGFPYIVASQSKKSYLWKGSGSSADELGCAKLIGMDIGSTGEIEEVDEGREPASFWDVFPGGKANGFSDAESGRYWPLKATSGLYNTRLFSVGVEMPRPKSSSSFLWGRRGSSETNADDSTMSAVIQEIVPYAQSDLTNEGIFVLDTFFEIYVLVPSNSKTLLPTLRAASEFAQEYSIIIASAEDRPFVPIGRVVLGRNVMPNGVKHAFRKWEDTRQGGSEAKVLPLSESLRAMTDQEKSSNE